MLSLFAHRKIRFKLLVALAPLVVVIGLVTLSTLTVTGQIDRRYGTLLEQGHTALISLTRANQQLQRLGLLLYQEIAETDPDRMQRIDAEIEGTYSAYKAFIATSIKAAPPQRARGIATTEALLDAAFVDSRLVRTKALVNAKDDAMRAMRGGLDAELRNAQQMLSALVDAMHDDTVKAGEIVHAQTRRTITVIGLLAAVGLVVALAVAGLLLRRDVVQVLVSLRDATRHMVEGRLEQRLAYCGRGDEAGEIHQALSTLQDMASTHATRLWIRNELTTLSIALQGIHHFADFATTLLSHIARSVDLLHGGLYIANETHTRFVRAGGFALSTVKHAHTSTAEVPLAYGLGEGLVGQAALERRTLVLTPPTDLPLHAVTGFGLVPLPQLVLIPVVRQNLVVAVLELAPVAPLLPRQQALLDALLPLLALNVHVLSHSLKIHTLQERIVALEGFEQQLQSHRQELTAVHRTLAGQNQRQEELAATLDQERNLLHMLIDQLPELVFIKDPRGIYRTVNHAFAAFLGRPVAEIIGRTDRDLADSATAHVFRDQRVANVATDAPCVTEETVTYADGSSIVLETTLVPFTRADGTPGGVIGISRETHPNPKL